MYKYKISLEVFMVCWHIVIAENKMMKDQPAAFEVEDYIIIDDHNNEIE